MLRLFSSRWVQTALLLLILGTAVTLKFHEPFWVKQFRYELFDYYNTQNPRIPGDGVVIVDIDEESLQQYGQWPWPRPMTGQLVQHLSEMGAKSIVFDMVFAEPDRTSPASIANTLPQEAEAVKSLLRDMPDNDAEFAQIIAEAGNVVTGFVGSTSPLPTAPALKTTWQARFGGTTDPRKHIPHQKSFATNLPALTEAAAGNGSFTIFPDQDGVIRRVPLLMGHAHGEEIRMYPALSLEALRVAQEASGITVLVTKQERLASIGYGISEIRIGEHTIPTGPDGYIWVHYAGHDAMKRDYLPAWKIMSRTLPEERIKDKIVLIGTSAIGLFDMRSTPMNNFLPGVEVHAEILEQILQQDYLTRPAKVEKYELYAMVGLGLLVILLMPFVGAINLALVVTVMIGGGFFASYIGYVEHGMLIDPIYPSLVIIMTYSMASVFANLRTEAEKRAVRTAFGHYISPDLMEELTQDPDKLELGGETRELSVMFTDIRNFSTISENMDPEELIRLMNDFLTPMTDKVLQNRGTIDKYIGDAMMAFWNAPLDDADHARHACDSALHMYEVLEPVNAALAEKCKAEGTEFMPLKAGIGINTGPCSVGNMGSKQRFAYSALGDAVNLAARLEGQTKTYGVPILIGEETRKQVPDFACLELDLVQVKGRTEPERIYFLMAAEKSTNFGTLNAKQQDMLSLYRAGDFEGALELIDACHKLGGADLQTYYSLMRRRIEEYLATAPAANWDGVYIAQTK